MSWLWERCIVGVYRDRSQQNLARRLRWQREFNLGQSPFDCSADLLIPKLCGKLASIPSHITTLFGLLGTATVAGATSSSHWKLSQEVWRFGGKRWRRSEDRETVALRTIVRSECQKHVHKAY